MARTLIAGNWKMNGLRADLEEVRAVAGAPEAAGTRIDVLLCLPATLLREACVLAQGTALRLGGQTCHTAVKGAYTGDVSAHMLADAGASHVILGHSERRSVHGETSAMIAAQAEAALGAGLKAIICVGETLAEREGGQVLDVIAGQLGASIPEMASPGELVIAYEPVWAIGTGHVAGPVQIAEVHGLIRQHLRDRFGEAGSDIAILYGGSMNPANAAEILAVENVNGGLVGGASLRAVDFLQICAHAERQAGSAGL